MIHQCLLDSCGWTGLRLPAERVEGLVSQELTKWTQGRDQPSPSVDHTADRRPYPRGPLTLSRVQYCNGTRSAATPRSTRIQYVKQAATDEQGGDLRFLQGVLTNAVAAPGMLPSKNLESYSEASERTRE